MKIVGVSGRDRSGKDTIAEYLIEKGYFGYSLGDAVRRHSMTRHKDKEDPISVRNMTETSNWLRTTYGPDVVLKQALEEYEKALENGKVYKGIVVYSVRAPIEVDFILDNDGVMVWIESSDETRYRRKIANMREGEAKVTIEEMLSQEALQTSPQADKPREVQMDLQYVQSKATVVIENNSDDIEQFFQKAADQLSNKLEL